ncbi:MAG: aminoacyl-tRNA hydrolase [Candidatus Hydrogenedentes bacterium]|nr:aminoacyl-tRNA hydrolase [Candidatus Hydrogenedentota bacterium]
MKVIVGLGNPGPRYRNTRHNLGFRVLDCLAGRLGAGFSREKYGGLMAEAACDGQRLLLLKPLTFMNNSGVAVAQAARNNVHGPDDLLVVVDDVDLPLGRVRLRARGSAGGHNGLKSVIEHLGTREFARLRMGVGKDAGPGELIDHVLGTFQPEEWPVVDRMVEQAADVAQRFVAVGVEAAMSECNAPAAGESDGGNEA